MTSFPNGQEKGQIVVRVIGRTRSKKPSNNTREMRIDDFDPAHPSPSTVDQVFMRVDGRAGFEKRKR